MGQEVFVFRKGEAAAALQKEQVMPFDKAAYWERRAMTAHQRKAREVTVYVCPKCRSSRGTLVRGRWLCSDPDHERRVHAIRGATIK